MVTTCLCDFDLEACSSEKAERSSVQIPNRPSHGFGPQQPVAWGRGHRTEELLNFTQSRKIYPFRSGKGEMGSHPLEEHYSLTRLELALDCNIGSSIQFQRDTFGPSNSHYDLSGFFRGIRSKLAGYAPATYFFIHQPGFGRGGDESELGKT